MGKKALPLLGAAAALGLMILLFQPTPSSSNPTAPDRRRPMPEYQASALDGSAWKLSDHRGRVVLLNFWASWCSPCRRETPGLVRLARQYADKGLEVAGVAMDDNLAPVRRFVADRNIPYPILVPAAGDTLAERVESLPTTLLIDARGRVAKTYYGAESESVFRRDIEHLLAEK